MAFRLGIQVCKVKRYMATDFPDLSDLTPGAQRILDVASRLFYEEGIHAVGVDTIAAESGVSKPILYKNFGSKDGLVVAYLLNRHRWWWALLEEEVEHAESPRALAFFTVYAADHGNSRRGCAFLNAAAELPADHPAFDVIRYHKHALCDRLEELVKEVSATEVDHRMLANHLFLLLEGAFAHRPIYGTELVWQGREMAARLLARPEIVGRPA